MSYGFAFERKDRGYGNPFYGKYRGEVTDIKDPLKMGRVKALCPSVFGPSGETDWALPCMPPGFKRIPQVGDFVWVEFEEGNIDYPVWTGVWFTEGKFEITDDTVKINGRKVLTELDKHEERLDAHDKTLKNHGDRITSIEGRI